MSLRSAVRRTRRAGHNREDPVLANARRMLMTARRSGLDVLLLGDSMLTWWHPEDADQRRFPEMVQGVFEGRRCAAFHGPGYHVGIYHRYLQLLAAQGTLPRLLIVPMTYRQCTQMWNRHPAHGYAQAMDKLDDALASRRPAWRVRARPPIKDPAVMRTFRDLSHPCKWEGERSNGEFVDLIKKAVRDNDPEGVRHTYAYLHGEALDPELPAVRRVEEFGRYVSSLGVPLVSYENPVNIETGVSVWGEHFRPHAERNIQLVSNALLRGTGELGRVCRTGNAVGSESFVFEQDGIEHQRGAGRLFLAQAIAQQATRSGW